MKVSYQSSGAFLVLLLIVAAVVLGSWIAFASVAALLILWAFLTALDRYKPEIEPAPDAAAMFAALEEHKADTKRILENLAGKMEMRPQPRSGMRE